MKGNKKKNNLQFAAHIYVKYEQKSKYFIGFVLLIHTNQAEKTNKTKTVPKRIAFNTYE